MRGYLHRPAGGGGDGLVLTHGAGSNAGAPLLVSLADRFAARGVTALRCDLPYRQARPKGPPHPAGAARDREGLAHALEALRALVPGRLWLGGSSYGGRQASMLLAEAPEAADALLLLSYPLHPPGRPHDLRTGHFGRLATPALFVHGELDPFGSLEEVNAARALIPARTALVSVERAAHGLGPASGARRPAPATVDLVVERFLVFVAAADAAGHGRG